MATICQNKKILNLKGFSQIKHVLTLEIHLLRYFAPGSRVYMAYIKMNKVYTLMHWYHVHITKYDI